MTILPYNSIVLNAVSHISNYSTCETKHILSRKFNFNPKHKSNLPLIVII